MLVRHGTTDRDFLNGINSDAPRSLNPREPRRHIAESALESIDDFTYFEKKEVLDARRASFI
jgi:hypothetical protein